MNIYVYHNRQLIYNGPAPRGVGMLEFVPGCVADTCGDIDLTRYEVKRIGFTLNGAPVIYVQERTVEHELPTRIERVTPPIDFDFGCSDDA